VPQPARKGNYKLLSMKKNCVNSTPTGQWPIAHLLISLSKVFANSRYCCCS